MKKFKKDYPNLHKGIRYTKNAINIASKAYTMAKAIAAVVNSEKKYFDVAPAAASVGTTGWLTCLSYVPQGDTNVTRNGQSIALKSVLFKPVIHWNATGDQSLRLIIFRDNDNEETIAPTIGQLLETSNFLSPRNMDNPKRFTVLYDKIFTRDTTVGYKYPKGLYKQFFNKKDYRGNPTIAQHITWTGANGTDTARGHLYFLAIGNQDNNLPSVALYSRIRFYDN